MLVFFLGVLSTSIFIQTTESSVVSTGDFNKDFFVIWSPSHVITSADGHERSLKLDQESGITKPNPKPSFCFTTIFS